MLWQYRCDVRFRGTVPDISAFLRLLHSEVAWWLEMPGLSLAHQAVHLYMEGLQGWLCNRNIPVRDGSAVDVQKPQASNGLAWEWGTRPGAVYRWLRDDAFAPPFVALARPDGSATANIGEMDGLLVARNGRPVLPRVSGWRQIAWRRRALGLADEAARAVVRVKAPHAVAVHAPNTGLIPSVPAQLYAGVDGAARPCAHRARRYYAVARARPHVAVPVDVLVVNPAAPSALLGGCYPRHRPVRGRRHGLGPSRGAFWAALVIPPLR